MKTHGGETAKEEEAAGKAEKLEELGCKMARIRTCCWIKYLLLIYDMMQIKKYKKFKKHTA